MDPGMMESFPISLSAFMIELIRQRVTWNGIIRHQQTVTDWFQSAQSLL